MNTKKIRMELRDYLMIAIGMASFSLGWNLFLLPTHITASGVPGISSIVYWATNIPPQYTYFVINFFLLCAALMILGGKFCYNFWLKKKKKAAVFCLGIALTGFICICFYFWAGGPEKSVKVLKKLQREHI